MNERYEKYFFSKVVEKSINLSDVARNLNLDPHYGNRSTIKRYIEKYSLNTGHFFAPTNNTFKKRIPLSEILVENSTYSSTTNLKDRLYKEGIKERICELCSQDEEWQGKKMSLILDHINGVNNDHRKENLRIVCPNCNATLSTHSGKNIKNGKYKYVTNPKKYIKLEDLKRKEKEKPKEQIIYYCECGKIKSKQSKYCKECSDIKQQKVERPPLEQLLKEIEETNYSAVGRKYGVSDNAIRKWIKNYKKQNPS